MNMVYDFERGVPTTATDRAEAHTALRDEMAGWPEIPPEAVLLLRFLEHFGGVLDILQRPEAEAAQISR